MSFSAKNIFLIDGIGALVTTILLSQVLTRFENFFGMPQNTLWVLAAIALLFSIYSLTCQFLFRKSFTSLIKVIIIANLAYCLLTTVLVFYNLENITVFGILYFIGEIILILFLVMQEYRILKSATVNE